MSPIKRFLVFALLLPNYGVIKHWGNRTKDKKEEEMAACLWLLRQFSSHKIWCNPNLKLSMKFYLRSWHLLKNFYRFRTHLHDSIVKIVYISNDNDCHLMIDVTWKVRLSNWEVFIFYVLLSKDIPFPWKPFWCCHSNHEKCSACHKWKRAFWHPDQLGLGQIIFFQ